MQTILIIEDDTALSAGLARALSSDAVTAENCNSIQTARAKINNSSYSLIILDVNLPDGNGFDFLKEIKQTLSTPVIMLTANDMESDIVAGLEQGADDYITKPFSLAVLRARVQTQLRRVNSDASTNVDNSCYALDDYIFDFGKMEFYYKGTPVELSKTEQKLLRILTENAGTTLTRSRLIDFVWSDGAEYVDENALSVAIKRLRDKLSAQDCIKTVYGIGYIWEKYR
ncbi:MAG: response regulator transcription factor [Lachnospiraceae bacterium]|nr:response regulator transcription factor [Lachnospiraceae bacterium]